MTSFVVSLGCLFSIDIIIGDTFRPLNHSLAVIAGTLAAVSGYKSSIFAPKIYNGFRLNHNINTSPNSMKLTLKHGGSSRNDHCNWLTYTTGCMKLIKSENFTDLRIQATFWHKTKSFL